MSRARPGLVGVVVAAEHHASHYSSQPTEKAKLEAKLELQTERDAMTQKVLELVTENARLKAQAEVAEPKEPTW